MSTAKSFRQLIGVPPSTASPLDSTLIIIDAQNEYQDGQLKTENIKSTRAAIGSLLEKYRAGGKAANIVHVTHATPSGAPVFTPDTPLAEEFSELKPKEGEHVIKKNYPSSFAGTDLEEYLKKNDAKKVVLAGYMAHVCVSTTCRDAAQKGYDVLLAEEAIGDRGIPGVDAETLKAVTLKELDDAFGTVISAKDIK